MARLLDDVARPNIDSPALALGDIVTLGGITRRYADIFGSIGWDNKPTLGAAQGWMST